MKFRHFANFVLLIFFCGFLNGLEAQTEKTNHPFSWKETTDAWYMQKAYAFQYIPDEMTPKGNNTVGHGPACSNACKETTSPDACTESLVNESTKAVELTGVRIPTGYSGVEYITFDVQKNGKVYGYKVVKQPVVCPPCIQNAVNIVASLGEWYPAMKDGVAVKSTVVVPVYFK